MLDHPDLPWLATEQEKVACFAQLWIDPELLPKRIYAGRANGRVRNFHIKMPLAVEQDRAVFTYIDPGMGTPSDLHSWGGADHQRSRKKILTLQLAVDNADWETLEPYGDLDAAMRKIHQFEQQNPNFNGPGMIDNFRLRGSRPCRRMGVPLSDGGWRMQVVHAFGNHKTALSEGAALAAVVEAIPGNPHRTWVGTDSPSPLR